MEHQTALITEEDRMLQLMASNVFPGLLITIMTIMSKKTFAEILIRIQKECGALHLLETMTTMDTVNHYSK